MRLFGRTRMEPETVTMLDNAQAFQAKILWKYMRQNLDGILQGEWVRKQFPGSFTLQDAAGQPFLTGGTQQASVEVAEVTFTTIVGTRETRDIVTMEQTGSIMVGRALDRLEEAAQLRMTLAGCVGLGEDPVQFVLHLGARSDGFVVWIQAVGDLFQPGCSLAQRSVLYASRLQGRAQTPMQANQLRVRMSGDQMR